MNFPRHQILNGIPDSFHMKRWRRKPMKGFFLMLVPPGHIIDTLNLFMSHPTLRPKHNRSPFWALFVDKGQMRLSHQNLALTIPSHARGIGYSRILNSYFQRNDGIREGVGMLNKKTAAIFLLLISILATSAIAQTERSTHQLTLEESVALAKLHSPAAASVRSTRDAALISAERDRPSSSPTLNLIAGGSQQGTRVTFPRPDGSAATVLPEQTGRVSLIFEQPLYHAGLKQASSRFAVEQQLPGLEYQRDIAALVLSVKKAYIDFLRTESGVQIASKQVDGASQYHLLALKQIDAGLAKPVDAETSNASLLEAKAGLVLARDSLQSASLNFNRLLGRELETKVELVPFSGLPAISTSPREAVAAAMHDRPEIISTQKNLDSAKAGLQLAKLGSTPSLHFRGELTRQTDTALLPANHYAATIEMRWPLLDAGKTRQDTREAQAGIVRLEAALEEAKQNIAMEVTRAWVHLRSTFERYDLIRQQTGGAAATEIVAEKAYEVGRGTFLELQSANRQVQLAKESENQALYEVWEAKIEFDSASGADSKDLQSKSTRGVAK